MSVSHMYIMPVAVLLLVVIHEVKYILAGSCTVGSRTLQSGESNGLMPKDVLALIPSYTIQCEGFVSQWTVVISGEDKTKFDINFLIWRPGSDGDILTLVGQNLFSIEYSSGQSVYILQPNASDMIRVNVGDVIGVYTFHTAGITEQYGVQLMNAQDNITIFHKFGLDTSSNQSLRISFSSMEQSSSLLPLLAMEIATTEEMFTDQVISTKSLHEMSNTIYSLVHISTVDTPYRATPVVSTKHSVESTNPSVVGKNDNGEIPVIMIVVSLVFVLACLLVVMVTILLICMVARKRCRKQGNLKGKVDSKVNIENPLYDGQILKNNNDYAVPIIINPAYNLHTILPTPPAPHNYELCRSSPLEYLKPITLFNAIPGIAKPVKNKQLRVLNDRTVSTSSAIYETPLTPSHLDMEGSRNCNEHEHYELAVNAVSLSGSEAMAHTSYSNTPSIHSPGYEVPLHAFEEYCSETSDFTGIDRTGSVSNDRIKGEVKSWIYQNGSNTSLNKT